MNELTTQSPNNSSQAIPTSNRPENPEAELRDVNDDPKQSTMVQKNELDRRPLGRRLSRFAGYSRYVVFMKLLLPAAALALISAIVVWPQIQIEDNSFSIGIPNIKVSSKESPNMVNARFMGSDKKNQPFSITADLAKNLLLGKTNIELEMPKADITVRDGTWLVLTADTGVYNQSGKTLSLEGKVNLFHDSGYEFNTAAADIDLNGGVAKGTVPVSGQGPFGHLEAEGFIIENKGSSIYFIGRSKLILHEYAVKNGR